MRRVVGEERRASPPVSVTALTLACLAPSTAVDEELGWFFSAEDGDFASVSNFGRLLSPVADDGQWRTPEDHGEALERHRVIRARLKSIPNADAGVLQCAYAPRPWPFGLVNALGRLTGIVVRLACDRATWPRARGEQLVVDARNADRLHAMIGGGGDETRGVHDLRREAQVRFARALGHYSAARRGGAVLGVR